MNEIAAVGHLSEIDHSAVGRAEHPPYLGDRSVRGNAEVARCLEAGRADSQGLPCLRDHGIAQLAQDSAALTRLEEAVTREHVNRLADLDARDVELSHELFVRRHPRACAPSSTRDPLPK